MSGYVRKGYQTPKAQKTRERRKAYFKSKYGARDNYIYRLIAEDNHTYDEVGGVFDISRERVRQIVERENGGPMVDRVNGGSFNDPILALRYARSSGVKSLNQLISALPVQASPNAVVNVLEGIGAWEAVQRLWRMRKKSGREERRKKFIERYQIAAKLLGKTPGAPDMVHRRAGLKPGDIGTAQKLWGNLKDMQIAAGFKPNETGRPKPSAEVLEQRKISLIERVQEAAVIIGRTPRYEDTYAQVGRLTSADGRQAQLLFGSWNKMVIAAGLEPNISKW